MKKWLVKVLCKLIKRLDKTLLITDLKDQKDIIRNSNTKMFGKSVLQTKVEKLDLYKGDQ